MFDFSNNGNPSVKSANDILRALYRCYASSAAEFNELRQSLVAAVQYGHCGGDKRKHWKMLEQSPPEDEMALASHNIENCAALVPYKIVHKGAPRAEVNHQLKDELDAVWTLTIRSKGLNVWAIVTYQLKTEGKLDSERERCKRFRNLVKVLPEVIKDMHFEGQTTLTLGRQ